MGLVTATVIVCAVAILGSLPSLGEFVVLTMGGVFVGNLDSRAAS